MPKQTELLSDAEWKGLRSYAESNDPEKRAIAKMMMATAIGEKPSADAPARTPPKTAELSLATAKAIANEVALLEAKLARQDAAELAAKTLAENPEVRRKRLAATKEAESEARLHPRSASSWRSSTSRPRRRARTTKAACGTRRSSRGPRPQPTWREWTTPRAKRRSEAGTRSTRSSAAASGPGTRSAPATPTISSSARTSIAVSAKTGR